MTKRTYQNNFFSLLLATPLHYLRKHAELSDHKSCGATNLVGDLELLQNFCENLFGLKLKFFMKIILHIFGKMIA